MKDSTIETDKQEQKRPITMYARHGCKFIEKTWNSMPSLEDTLQLVL